MNSPGTAVLAKSPRVTPTSPPVPCTSSDEQIIERVAALDIGKAEIVCCVRLPGADGERRVQEVSTHQRGPRTGP